MGKVVLARVDSRLIHGQVMTTLAGSSGANAIFVADTDSANDKFTKNMLLTSGSRTGMKTRVLKNDGAVRYWNDRQYDNYKVILITKTIEVMAEIIAGGVPITELNIGGLPERPNTRQVINAVWLEEKQLDTLKKLEDAHGVTVYFQDIPSARKVSLASAIKNFKK